MSQATWQMEQSHAADVLADELEFAAASARKVEPALEPVARKTITAAIGTLELEAKRQREKARLLLA
jgi:hypothetical protein